MQRGEIIPFACVHLSTCPSFSPFSGSAVPISSYSCYSFRLSPCLHSTSSFSLIYLFYAVVFCFVNSLNFHPFLLSTLCPVLHFYSCSCLHLCRSFSALLSLSSQICSRLFFTSGSHSSSSLMFVIFFVLRHFTSVRVDIATLSSPVL